MLIANALIKGRVTDAFFVTTHTAGEVMPPESRRHRRCAIDSDEIQVSIFPIRKTFSVKDISRGGLAFEYPPLEDEYLESESVVIIAVDFNWFYPTNIACKTVYDIPTLMHGKSFTGSAVRRRGMKFVELTKEHEAKLFALLERCLERTGK
jgi:hypothetical protein